MKTIKKLSAIFLMAAACAAWPAAAQTNTPPATNAQVAPRPRIPRYTGTITGVDSANMILSIKGRTGTPDNKLKITHDTKIRKDGQPAQFSDAAEGLRVNATYKKGDDGVSTAITLNIMTKPPTPKKTPAPAPATKAPE
jgi:hypothetical protein